MISSRRTFVAGLALVAFTGTTQAADRIPFTESALRAAQDAKRPILVHVTAPWCGVCEVQKEILAKLADRPDFKDLAIIDVDFDSRKDVVRRFKASQQSVLITFKGKQETSRSVAQTSPKLIESQIKKAF